MIVQDTASSVISDSLAKDSVSLADSLPVKDTIHLADTVTQIAEKRFDGILHPSFPHTEPWVFVLLLILFLILVYSTVRSFGWIKESITNFFQVKERSSIFSTVAVNDIQSKILLQVFSTGVISLLVYLLFRNTNENFSVITWFKFFGITSIFLIFKYFTFKLIDYIFFESRKMNHAISSYFNIFVYLSILIFPLLVIDIYAVPQIQKIIPALVIILFVIGAILVIIKLFQIFFNKIVAIFYILLYLCTLEILPLLILYGVYKLMV